MAVPTTQATTSATAATAATAATGATVSPATGSALPSRPAAVTRVSRLVWLLVLLGVVLTVLAVVLDDEIIRSTRSGSVSADDTRVPPSFTPVVVVLDVVLSGLLLVLLAFVRGAHSWARHSLAATLALLALGAEAVLYSTPPAGFVAPILLLVGLVGYLLHLLYRPDVTAFLRF